MQTDRALDRSPGPRWLADSRVAGLVADTILAGETERRFYQLGAWVVMPNHVHVLILPKVTVPDITRWVKGSTARGANELLGRTGQHFWQDESFDRRVRNERELNRIIRYIEWNPIAAALATTPELYPWSSACWQAKPPAPPRATQTF